MSSIVQSVSGPVFAYGARRDAITARGAACPIEGHSAVATTLPAAIASASTNRRRFTGGVVMAILCTLRALHPRKIRRRHPVRVRAAAQAERQLHRRDRAFFHPQGVDDDEI